MVPEFMLTFFSFQINEMLIPKWQAEKVIREHSGDVVAALEALTN